MHSTPLNTLNVISYTMLTYDIYDSMNSKLFKMDFKVKITISPPIILSSRERVVLSCFFTTA